jgi:NitT/TauT family transport system substrate-binding protein
MKISRKHAIAAIAGGVAVGQLTLQASAANDIVRIGGLASDPGMEAIYASQRGFAKQFGLEFSIQNFPNGAAIIAGIIGGSLDVGNTNWVSILQAREKGLPLVAVSPAVIYSSKEPTSFIMVPNDSPAQNAKDLNGKTIAVDGLGNLTQLGVMAWIDKGGGDLKSIKFTEIPFSEMPAALGAHRVDAALITEPLATQAKSAGRIVGNPYDAIAPEFPSSAWVATETWAANTDLAARFAKTMYRTAQWANTNRPTTASILTQFSKLDLDTILTMHRARYSAQNDAKFLPALVDVALRYGSIKQPVKVSEVYAGSVRGA